MARHQDQNGIPTVAQGRQLRSLVEWDREAKELGFEMRIDHDPASYTVWVMLKPVTQKAKTAIDRAAGEHCDFITVETCYDKNSQAMRARGIHPPARDDEDKALTISLDDSAAYAITMARRAIEGSITPEED